MPNRVLYFNESSLGDHICESHQTYLIVSHTHQSLTNIIPTYLTFNHQQHTSLMITHNINNTCNIITHQLHQHTPLHLNTLITNTPSSRDLFDNQSHITNISHTLTHLFTSILQQICVIITHIHLHTWSYTKLSHHMASSSQ